MTDQILPFIQALAWPVVVLIAFLGARGKLVELAGGATALKRFSENPEDLIKLLEHVKELQGNVRETRDMLEAISIKDKSKELEALTEAKANVDLAPDEMFAKIQLEWTSIVDLIRRIGRATNVKTNLIGNVGVGKSLDDLVTANAVSLRAAELVKALSSQWQWMFRTTSPREEWLTSQTFTSFVKVAGQAKAALKLGKD